jgi:predicted DNA-binding transcriptional regulator AlpA
MHSDKNPDELLSPEQLEAERIGSRSTLAKWRLSGFGPDYLKLGSRVVYRRRDVDAWLESRKRNSTSQAA